MNGVRIRSRVKWLAEGERPSKFFCNLEKYNYVEKTIKKVCNDQGKLIFDQKLILAEIKNFYSKLFAKQKSSKEHEFLGHISDYGFSKLNSDDKISLEGKLKPDELSQALKSMKNEKTPGIDGFQLNSTRSFGANLKMSF